LCKGVLLTVTPDGIQETRLGDAAGPAGAAWYDPSWSPDGRRFAIAEGVEDALYVINADGTGARRLVSGGSGDFSVVGIFHVHWSPDGTRIAYTRVESQEEVSGDAIRVVNVDGTGDKEIARGEFVAWSPDGAAVVYEPPFVPADDSARQERSELFAVAVDGNGQPGKLLDTTAAQKFALSPSGTKVAYSAVVPVAGDVVGRLAFLITEIDEERETTEVVPPPGPSDAGGIDHYMFVFSPDGERLVFGYSIPDPDTGELSYYVEVVNVDGSGRQRITGAILPEQQLVEAKWSRDGSYVVIAVLDQVTVVDLGVSRIDEVFVAPVDGSGEMKPELPFGLGCPSELSVRPAPEE
jgi:Tol biopolymer transport system component